MSKASMEKEIIEDYEDEEELGSSDPLDALDSEGEGAEEEMEEEELEIEEEDEEEVEFTTAGEQLEDLELQIGDCDFEDLDGVYTEEPTMVNAKTTASIRTTPYLTKYELVKVKGLRVQMLDKHAPPCVEPELFPDGKYPHDTEAIALMELRHKRLPFLIRRPLPNGQHELVPVSQLLVKDNF